MGDVRNNHVPLRIAAAKFNLRYKRTAPTIAQNLGSDEFKKLMESREEINGVLEATVAAVNVIRSEGFALDPIEIATAHQKR